MPHAAVNRTHTRVFECESVATYSLLLLLLRVGRARLSICSSVLSMHILYIYFYFPFWGFSSLLTHLLIAFTIHTQFALETTYTIFSYFAAEHIEMQQHWGRK